MKRTGSDRRLPAATGYRPQTDPPPRATKEESLAMDIIPPEEQTRPPQPEDTKRDPAPQQCAPIQHDETQRSKTRGQKRVRDYTYSDVKPIILKNRENGQKTKATAIYRYLNRQYGDLFGGQLRTVQRMVRDLNEKLDAEHNQRIKRPGEAVPGDLYQSGSSSRRGSPSLTAAVSPILE